MPPTWPLARELDLISRSALMNTLQPRPDRTYFEHSRPELLALIPLSAKRVLDVGCAAGGLGRALKQRQPVEVVGVELDPEAAERARCHLDQVLVGDVEQLSLDFPPRSWDCIVCGDLLEHLRDPLRLLRRLRPLLTPAGRLVASLPNVRHHSVVSSLLEGNWTYEASGLLDATHLHFFTRASLQRLLVNAGYSIDACDAIPGPGHARWQQRGRPRQLDLGQITLEGLPVDQAEEFFIYQHLIVATPSVTAAASQTIDGLHTDEDPRPVWEPIELTDVAKTGEIYCDHLHTLSEPDDFLRQAHELLPDDGLLRLCVPNVQHHRIVSALLHGDWPDSAADGSARKPLRFFTRRELEKLLYRCNYQITQHTACGDDDAWHEWQRRGCPGQLKLGGLALDRMTRQEAEDFYATHFELEARPVAPPAFGLTSIIILTHDQLPYTQQCLESIRLRTLAPYELIVVDNGSQDGTVEYLRQQRDVQLLANDQNRGFPAGCNQGIHAARGEQVLLLNNDVVVTTGWLERMLTALTSDPAVGLVGPSCNCVSGSQQIDVPYQDLTQLDGFAWHWGQAHAGQWLETDRLVGFCLLFRRELVHRIGLLDERFGVGNFEDDDFCRRARDAGYRALHAQDAFVHHFGGATFRALDLDYASLLDRNEQLYRNKWEQTNTVTADSGSQPDASALPQVAPSGNLLQHGDAATAPCLSLCMIVRNSARTLEACLASIQPWVDEMVVVDTGSDDRTPQIATHYGTRLFHFPWPDSFAAARNESLRHAHGRWIFWMDSDDTISPDNGRKLRQLAHQPAAPSVLGYVMQVHCPGPCPIGVTDVTVVDQVKMFRNLSELRFEGRIHEQILPAVRRLGGDVQWTDIHVVHSGADHTPEGQLAKWQRDLWLLELELQDHPDHPFALFNLGMTLADKQDHLAAIDALQRSLAVSEPHESHVRKLYSLLVTSHAALDHVDQAWRCCQQGLQTFPDDPELLFRRGMLAQRLGRLSDAEQAYLSLMRQPTDRRHFSSVDRSISGFKVHSNLALVYTAQRQLALAEQQWREAIAAEPDASPCWASLADNLLEQDRIEPARELAEQMDQRPKLRLEGYLVRAKIAQAQHQHPLAHAYYQYAIQQAPGVAAPLHAYAQYLFERDDLSPAEEALLRLAALEPEDASVRQNLGTVYLRQGQFGRAVDAYRTSIHLRPHAAETHLFLGHALENLQQPEAAAAAFRQACQLAPHDSRPRVALARLQSAPSASSSVLE